MPPSTNSPAAILPTRRLNKAERAVWDRVLAQFSHLGAGDAEQLTAYCEAAIRYESAAKELKKHPTVSVPIVNRASGNVVGHKEQRNTAAVTLKESLAQMTTLARRLLIDAASAAKRERLATSKARAFRAAEHQEAAPAERGEFPEEEIEAMIRCLTEYGARISPTENIRDVAIFQLRLHQDRQDPDLAHLFSERPHPRQQGEKHI